MKTTSYTAEVYRTKPSGRKIWCVRQGARLLAVTLYRKGAESLAIELTRLSHQHKVPNRLPTTTV